MTAGTGDRPGARAGDRRPLDSTARAVAISFARGAPAPEALATDLVADCTRAALEADGVRVLSYGTGNGYPPLRELLGRRARGARPTEVLITNGSLQGFVFLLETLLEPGDLVAVERPTYDRALLQLRLHGMEVLPITVEDDGMDVEALEAACAEGRAPAPALHDPQLPEPVRARPCRPPSAPAWLEVCDRHGILVLEDDPYGKLRFEGEALPGLFERPSRAG